MRKIENSVLDLSEKEVLTERIWFDPHKAFLDLTIVRGTIFLILVAALLSLSIIIWNSNFTFDLSGDGFNTAITQFKVPIGLCTLSIPMLALLAANHRSEQTKRQMALTLSQIKRTDKQIELTHNQNRFSNYFKHQEEFVKRFSKNEDNPSVASPHKLYGLLFPDAKKGDLSISSAALHDLEECATNFLESCRGFSTSNWLVSATHMHIGMYDFLDKYRIFGSIKSGARYNVDGDSFILSNNSPKGSIVHFVIVLRFIEDIFSFDDNYKTPSDLDKVFKINLDLIPEGQIQNNHFPPFDIDNLIAPHRFGFKQGR